MKNLFSEIPVVLHDELLETLLDADTVRIERIVSHGHSSPDGFWYDQKQHEWVVLLKGAARLRFHGDDNAVEMEPGDIVNIPAHKRQQALRGRSGCGLAGGGGRVGDWVANALGGSDLLRRRRGGLPGIQQRHDSPFHHVSATRPSGRRLTGIAVREAMHEIRSHVGHLRFCLPIRRANMDDQPAADARFGEEVEGLLLT